jgi:hypothetical protein
VDAARAASSAPDALFLDGDVRDEARVARRRAAVELSAASTCS